MEELDALDKKALEKQHVDSYSFSWTQKIVAIIAVLIVVSGILGGLVFFVLNLISLINK